MDKSKLKDVLESHKKWLDGNTEGRADLRRANLSDANLRGANLRRANLSDADLRYADLRGADLRDANLSDADLRDANLSDADLWGANLRRADLRGANLRRADLRGADLRDANLSDADLWGANLRRADLRGANLWGANLWGANLWRADLSDAYLPSPTLLLLAYWGEVSDKLTTELMRYDASNHRNPETFTLWANGGDCPYSRGFDRAANFQEKRELWKPGKAKSALELVLMLFDEKEIRYDKTL